MHRGDIGRAAVIGVLVGLGVLAGVQVQADGDRSASARRAATAEIRGLLEDIAGSDLLRFDTHDDRGYPIEPGAIVIAPGGGYAAVYWVVLDSTGAVATELATSPDLVAWTWRVTLAEGATQPTIEPSPDGGWVVG